MSIIEELYSKWVDKRASKEEVEQLFEILGDKDITTSLQPLMKARWREGKAAHSYNDQQQEQLLKNIFSKYPVQHDDKQLEKTIIGPTHRIHLLKSTWFRYAAVIILMLGAATYLWINHPDPDSANHVNSVNADSDIHPASNRAILTLADGSTIMLENKDNGKPVTELHKNTPGPVPSGSNSINTPKGGQYQLILPDGTKVWLNAASSITYPTAFAGTTREVSITGEAYFEVALDKIKPFFVKTTQEQIAVLGTSFNVNAYTDEPAAKISLIEGSIKVNNKILSPGEAYSNGNITLTNVDRDMAWKKGAFNFNDMTVAQMMRQLSRWYDVDVIYKNGIPKGKFGGEIGRDLTLNEVLIALKNVGINCRIQGRNLIVME